MKVNKAIGCTVEECKYHAGTQPYCSLNSIDVVKHTNVSTSEEDTDCGSFEINRR